MTRIASIRSIARFASVAVLVVAVRAEQAPACGGDWATISELTTFDPKVLGESLAEGLYYDPFTSSYQGDCDGCKGGLLEDWKGYFKDLVKPADWEQVLFKAEDGDLSAIALRLAGKSRTTPKGYEQSSIWNPAAKDKLIPAITFVQLARRVEPYATFETYDPDGNPKTRVAPPEELLVRARAAMKSAKDPFLAQRYAFQGLRVTFYRRDWPAVVSFFDTFDKLLAGPSAELAWSARHYTAGALARNGNRARANLELARIHAGYPRLSGQAAQEFSPQEDKDWRESLRLAKTTREKTELWRLVGIKKDGIVATQEILKLEPKSNLIGLLLVRELARAESRVTNSYGKPDAKDVAAQKKAYAQIEQIAVGLLARGGDRPWLMELIAGHIAAKRGDLSSARSRLGRAMTGKPGDLRVASQARASLAMALVASWRISPQYEDELAVAFMGIDKSYGRTTSVRDEVRKNLAKLYDQAGRHADAEFLWPGTVDAVDPDTQKRLNPGKARWSDAAFIREMIARTGKTSSEFERFVLQSSLERAGLEQDLAMRMVLDGDYAAAAKMFKDGKPKSIVLGTDPFVMRIVDCHDCDHEKYKNAKWTHATFVARLVELEQKVKQGGEAGAEAALMLGNALYNVTWYGNARVILGESHQATTDTAAASRWYKRAFDLSKNRELKAKAAYFAAKAELGHLITDAGDTISYRDALPVPSTWFPVLKQYANTKYYKEVVKECGHFARWAK